MSEKTPAPNQVTVDFSGEKADTEPLKISSREKADETIISLDSSADPLRWSKKYKGCMVAPIECMTLIEYLLPFTVEQKNHILSLLPVFW